MSNNKFNYNLVKYEKINCGLCGLDVNETISNKDRYGLSTKAVICRNCGLIFINPRMSKEDYNLFYQDTYRKQLIDHKNRLGKFDLDKLFIKTTNLGRKLACRFNDHINSGLTLEIGSSCGGVLSGLKLVRPDLEVFGLEPSSMEAEYANNKGIKNYVSMFENFKEVLFPLQNIFIIRSFNYLLDPAFFIKWSHDQLVLGGKLVIMVIDFVEACRRRGVLKTQIDHPYMLTQKTLTSFVQSGDFNIEYNIVDGDYIYLVAKKNDSVPFKKLEINPFAYKEAKKYLKSGRLWWHYQINKLFN